MRTKLTILLIVLASTLSAYAEIKILSTKSWYPTLSGTWNKAGGLSYSNTVYGDTYYNPQWRDVSKSRTIEHMDVTRYFYLRPDRKKDWSFSMPLTNLHAEPYHSYWSKSNPNRKQNVNDIYWGIYIGYKANGVSRTAIVWLKCENGCIIYNVDKGGWKMGGYYPSCDPNRSPVFGIETYAYGQTYLKWGDLYITDFPAYMEELTYITIMVGTQAKVQIGKPSAHADGVNKSHIYTASEYMEQENYAMVKQKLYKAKGEYYEMQAVNLAIAYVALDELDNALELVNALIKYNGEYAQVAYTLRGFIKENQGKKLEALEDYQRGSDQESYNRLYNEIYKPQPIKQNQQKPTQKKSEKPALTK